MKKRWWNLRKALPCLLAGACFGNWPGTAADAPNVSVDLSGYSPDCGVQVRPQASRIDVNWPMDQGECPLVKKN